MTKHLVGRRSIRRGAGVALVAGALVAAIATPAFAQNEPIDGNRRVGVGNQFVREGESIDTAVIAIDGDATVAGRTSKSVFVVKGDAVISGRVGGGVIVVNGNARISGRVDEDVVVLDGRAILTDGAVVRGDVSSTNEPRVERGARVSGKVDNIDTTGAFTAIGFSILGILWLAVTVSTALLGLLLLVLFRRPFETAATTERTDTGKSIGLGLATAIGLPIVAIVAVTTIVGLPFGLGILGAHGLLWSLGYVISAMCLGRTMIKAPRSAFGAFFAGWGILRLAALIPGLGALVWLGASVIGLGALVLAGFRGSRTGGSADSQSAPPAPTPVAVPVAKPAAASTGTAEKAAPVKKAPAKKAKPGADGG